MYHCVQRVGFDTAASLPYWMVGDTWSTDWSEAGFTRLPWRENPCLVVSEAGLPSGVLLERLRPSRRSSVMVPMHIRCSTWQDSTIAFEALCRGTYSRVTHVQTQRKGSRR